MTKQLRLFSALLLIGAMPLIFANCSDDDENGGGNEADLVGTWTIESAAIDITVDGKSLLQWYKDEGYPDQDAQAAVDFIEGFLALGFQGTVTMNSNNTYTSNIAGESESGTWSLSSDGKTLTLTADGDPETFDLEIVSLSSNTLVLSFEEMDMDDLNDDQVDETLVIEIEMTLEK